MTDYTITATETPADETGNYTATGLPANGAGNYTATTTKKKYQRSAPQKVAATSILAYHEERAKGTFKGIEKSVLQSLGAGKAKTRRQLAKDAGKSEPSGICAAMSNLEKKGLVRVAFEAKCPESKKLVSWFALSQTPLVESLANPVAPQQPALSDRATAMP